MLLDVLFAILPFANVEYPAIGASLLHTRLNQLGIRSIVHYLNFDLSEQIGLTLYAWIAERSDQHLLDPSTPAVSLVGEWFFADVVFGDQIPSEDAYITRFLQPEPRTCEMVPQIQQARQLRRWFVDHCVREIRKKAPRVVGFSTTFHQTCACLAVARLLKQLSHPPIIIFGGANCEGEMGLQMLRSFPWIDYVCTGEGDEVVPVFLQRLLRQHDPRPLPGLLRQGESKLSSPSPVREMDTLPVPDYSDYFCRLHHSAFQDRIQPRLPVESSRGCWWGQKQHCTFCGLNGATMAYRSKSPARLLNELSSLVETYNLNRIDFVDNILDLRYIDTVFPHLALRGHRLELFYETKSNLRLEQLRVLCDGYVRCIQPGIESFSNQVLRLMRKGCTGLQNIQFLRWCEELRMQVVWNIVYGFPGESPSEYRHMAELIPLLTHLQTPTLCIRVRMDRFSPLFSGAQGAGVAARRPMPAYSYVFPLQANELEKLAYFFEFDYVDGRDPAAYTRELISEVDNWNRLREQTQPVLDLFRTGEVVLIRDTRPCMNRPVHVLSDEPARVYLACDTARTPSGLARELGDVGEDEIRSILREFVRSRLTVEVDGQFLSLAVFRNRPPNPIVPVEQTKSLPLSDA